MPAVKPATVTQEQVLAPCSLKFDVNQRRTTRLCRHGKKGRNQKITQVRQSALTPQPTISTERIAETGTRQTRASKQKMCRADVEAVCGYEKRSRCLAKRRATVKRDVKEKTVAALTKVKVKVKVKHSVALLDTAQRWLWTVRKTEASATSRTCRLCNELENAENNCFESLHKLSYMLRSLH